MGLCFLAARWLVALPLVLALAACGASATVTPTVQPQPTALNAPATPAPADTPTVAPTVAPTATPEPAGVLPAPLLFVDDAGQLVRLAVDGVTITPLTREAWSINEFAVAPDGSLAYTTFLADEGVSLLVRIAADGSGRTELARGTLSGVTVAADGSFQAGIFYGASRPAGPDLPPGVWSFPASGEPILLVAATEPLRSADMVDSGTNYQPIAWSPDGRRLLLRAIVNFGPDGPGGDAGSVGLALYDAADGQVEELRPKGEEPLCFEPAWSRDSAAIYCANGAIVLEATPALWRIDPANGASQTLLPASEGEQQLMTLSPRDVGDGLYVMVGVTLSGPSGYSVAFTPRLFPRDGAAPRDLLAKPLDAGYEGVLWAPDGSGVIVGRMPTGMTRSLVWLPFDGGAAVELASGRAAPFKWGMP